jgi:hypothetical protein
MRLRAEFVVPWPEFRGEGMRRFTVEADVTVALDSDEYLMRNETLLEWDDYGPPPAWDLLEIDHKARGWNALSDAADPHREALREEASSELLPFVWGLAA